MQVYVHSSCTPRLCSSFGLRKGCLRFWGKPLIFLRVWQSSILCGHPSFFSHCVKKSCTPRFSYCKLQKLGWRPGNEPTNPHRDIVSQLQHSAHEITLGMCGIRPCGHLYQAVCKWALRCKIFQYLSSSLLCSGN